MRLGGRSLLAAAWLLACGAPEPGAGDPGEVRVRRGTVRASGPGRRLPDGRFLVDEAGTGPAGCVRLFSVGLPDATDAVARGGASPDTALAFSPDGSRLLVGAFGGHVVLLDAWTGEELASRSLAETSIRAVAFSPDGALAWVAAQSPDAEVMALDPTDLHTIASRPLALDVGTAAPAADDPYGVYQLPSAYALFPRPDGSVVALATHGWDTPDGRRNASRLVRLAPAGGELEVLSAWPTSGSADVVLGAADTDGARLAVAMRRSAAGPPPADLPVDGVRTFALPDLAPGTDLRLPTLPGFGGVFVWDALALLPDGLAVGTGDGRVVVRRGSSEVVLPFGTPKDPALPIAASVGFLRATGDELWAVTSRSWAPGSTDPEARPARLHPNERVVARWSLGEGEPALVGVWRGPYDVGGIVVSSQEVAVAAGPRDDGRTDLFGALVFDRGAWAEPVVCATEGPAYHVLALSEDGRVALAEVPWRDGDAVRGTYRVTVLR